MGEGLLPICPILASNPIQHITMIYQLHYTWDGIGRIGKEGEYKIRPIIISLNAMHPNTPTPHLTHSHYPNTVLSRSFPILLISSTWLGREKYILYELLGWPDWQPNSQTPAREVRSLSIWPQHSVQGDLLGLITE